MEPIMSEQDRVEVKKILEALTGDVQVDLYTKRASAIIVPGDEPCETCPETEQLLGEVASLNDKIKVTVHEKAAEGMEGIFPLMEFRGAGVKGKLRYFGIPAGYEFRTLLDTLVAVSSGDSGLSEESKKDLSKVSQPVAMQVFVTPG